MLNSDQLARMLSRASRVSDPIIYPSSTGVVSVVAKRHAYRKGKALMVINTPDPKEGIQLRRGKYEFKTDGTEVTTAMFADDDDSSVYVINNQATFYGTPTEALPLKPMGLSDGVTLHIEEGFYKAVLKAAVVHFQGNRVAFYGADQCNPLYVGILYGDKKLDGILIPTPMLRALLREAFYTSVKFHPTYPHQRVGAGVALASNGSDSLGVAVSVNGEDGERYTILQAGSIVAS